MTERGRIKPMSDEPKLAGEVHPIPWECIDHILHSEEELDGISFEEDENGTVVYLYGGMWSLNLFLLALAKGIDWIVEPDLVEFSRLYHTLAELTFDMSFPIPAPERGKDAFYVRMPNIRITGSPERN